MLIARMQKNSRFSKNELKDEHTCVFFNSVDDLALRVKSNLEKFFANKIAAPLRSKAFVSAVVSSTAVAKGDDFYIQELQPRQRIQV